MSFLSSASGASRWRGYEYWEEKKVTSYESVSDHEAEGVVKGSKEYQNTLLELLFDGPDWQYEKFVREHLE